MTSEDRAKGYDPFPFYLSLALGPLLLIAYISPPKKGLEKQHQIAIERLRRVESEAEAMGILPAGDRTAPLHSNKSSPRSIANMDKAESEA